jgi:integrase
VDRALSSGGERFLDTEEVRGSNPLVPTEKPQVTGPVKTNEYRVLPVPKELPLWEGLTAHVKGGGLIGKAHVFQTSGGGVIRPNNWRRRVWKEAMERAKIVSPPTPHSGRRTTASLLSAAGVPPATVQAILGHSTLQQTGEYIDVPRTEMESGLSRLADFYLSD